jgi:hypothetical protein
MCTDRRGFSLAADVLVGPALGLTQLFGLTFWTYGTRSSAYRGSRLGPAGSATSLLWPRRATLPLPGSRLFAAVNSLAV